MKTLLPILVLAALTLAPFTAATAEPEKGTSKTHRVVFEVTHEGVEEWTGVLNNVENLRKSLGAATEVVVVAHSKGLGMLVAKDNELSDRMKNIAGSGVVFAACENTMKKKSISKDQLVSFANTVDSGVAEVVRKQEAGWAYIKSGT